MHGEYYALVRPACIFAFAWTALTRVLGTPWERLMLSQGPTATIGNLLLTACNTDANLSEVRGRSAVVAARQREATCGDTWALQRARTDKPLQ